MVPADSHEISRAPCYSGKDKHSVSSFVYGGRTLSARPFKTVRLPPTFLTVPRTGRPWNVHPTTPTTQPLPGITRDRFSLFRFRSPLLTESLLFSLPVGTEMFHFPTFPPSTLYIQVAVTGLASSRVAPFGNPRINV